MKPISEHDLQMIKKILSLALEIESSALDHQIPEDELSKIHFILKCFDAHVDENLRRLSAISDHLHPTMSLKQLTDFMVPLERLIDRSVRDDEFLITSKDRPTKAVERRELYFVLDHIRSAFNVGSIFRLADSVGVKKIFLCGYTPTPEQQGLQKTAMGACEFVNSQSYQKTEDAIHELKKQGAFVIALETSEKSKDLFTGTLKGPTAYVVGNERFGLDRKILDLCDEVRSIPMFGIKNSLNVANSLSIAAYEWSRQNP